MSKERDHISVEIRMSNGELVSLDQYKDWDLVKVTVYRDSINGAHVLYVFEREVTDS